jgi:hypothetical protein
MWWIITPRMPISAGRDSWNKSTLNPNHQGDCHDIDPPNNFLRPPATAPAAYAVAPTTPLAAALVARVLGLTASLAASINVPCETNWPRVAKTPRTTINRSIQQLPLPPFPPQLLDRR